MRIADERRSLVAGLLLLSLASPAAADSFREEFDEPGGGVAAPTRFSVALLSLNGGIARDPIAPGLGAPSTGGVLPVDEGGDSELRFFEALAPSSASFAFTPETGFADVEVDGYVGIGFTDNFGVRSAALLVRVAGATVPTLDAYGVMFSHLSPGTQANLTLVRVRDGVVENLAASDPFTVATAEENYHLVLRAVGDALTAGVLRVEDVGGERVETPIDLDAAAGLQTELTVTDGELTAGALGLRAFTRSTNSVFFDDITVVDRVFADGFESGDTASWSAAVP